MAMCLGQQLSTELCSPNPKAKGRLLPLSISAELLSLSGLGAVPEVFIHLKRKTCYASIMCEVCELQGSGNSQGLGEREQLTAQGGNMSLLFLGQVVGGLQ